MALLVGENLSGPIRLSLAPIASGHLHQDAEQYVVEIWPADENGVVLRRQFSVQGWQTQQDDVWVFSRAFAEAAALLETTIPIDLWRIGRGRPANLFVSAWWINVVLWGVKPQKKIHAVISVAEDSNYSLFRQFSLMCKVEEAVRFGMELEKEIIEANPNWATDRRLKAGPILE